VTATEPAIVEPLSRAEWRAWLTEHAEDGVGAWVVVHKGKGSPLTYDEIVEEAVAFGWIDSKANKLDETRYKQWVAPRKAKSGWSASNKARIEKLEAAGLMTERGRRVIEAAKADGSWSKLDAVEAMEMPDDLSAALDAVPAARGYFDAFPRSTRRAILEWVSQTSNPDTRAKRVAKTAELAGDNIRANQWRQPKGAGS